MDRILIKNSIHQVRIEGYASDGSGVCRIGGRVVFVPGALMGEDCEMKILKSTGSAVYAKMETILRPSACRREPACPAFGKCGGCNLMHMSYEEELRFKLGRVNNSIRRIAGLSFKIDEIISADNIKAYRNKAIFAVGSSGGAPVTGFFRRRSHDIIPVSSCQIQPELSNRVVNTIKGWCAKEHIVPYNEHTGKGSIRHIFVRTASETHQAQAVIITARGFGRATDSLVNDLRKICPELTSIVLCVNKIRGNTVLAGDLHTLWGRDTISEALCGRRFEISPFTFFQVNRDQAEKLYSRVLEYAAPSGDETLLDLYCGAGTIALCLAGGARRVVGAEIVPEAIVNARRNAEINGVTNAEFICADAGRAASELSARGIYPDAIILDPPRKGLSPEVIAATDKMSPFRIVYVSCDPGTFARDLKRYGEFGWLPVSGTVIDMFPRTSGVETCCLLEKAGRS